jgi:hypothetical protein
MKLSSRSYPHPVVGSRDDVPGAAFQSVLEMSTDKEAVYIDAAINCSSKTVNDLIKKKDAAFALHVECTNTLYRKAFEFQDSKHRIQIPSDALNDVVEVNTFAIARRPLSGYRVQGAHADYGDATFEVDKGDIIAVGEGRLFDLEAKFDSLRPIGSIMEIHEAPEPGDMPMRVDYAQPKIQIVLSQNDFKDYKILKPIEGVSVALTTAIVLPVLIEAMRMAKDDTYEDLRWVRALQRRMETMGMKPDGEPLIQAQQILELPVRRTLASAMRYAGGDS